MWEKMPKCKGCKNVTGRNKVSFYVIPNPYLHKNDHRRFEVEKERTDKWLQNLVGGYDTTNFPFSNSQLICEKHFESSMFKDDIRGRVMGVVTRKLLKDDAYPTIFGETLATEKNLFNELGQQSHRTVAEPQTELDFSPELPFTQHSKITTTVDIGLQIGGTFVTEGTTEVAIQTDYGLFETISKIERDIKISYKALKNDHSYMSHLEKRNLNTKS